MYQLFIIFIALFCTSMLFELKEISSQKKVMTGWAFVTVIAVFCGFRFQFGGDWKVYIDAFYSIKGGGLDYPHEPLFRFLVESLVGFESGFLTLNIFCSLLFLGFCIKALYVYEDLRENIVSFLFFIFPIGIILLNLGFIRQGIACAVCLLSYSYFLKNKYIPSLLLLVLAQGFHVSAFLFIFYYLFLVWNQLENKKVKYLTLFSSIALSCICVVVLLKIRGQYIGGYKSDGLLPRIAYMILISSLMIYLSNINDFASIIKKVTCCTAMLFITYLVFKKFEMTTALDRALYYLLLPICFDIVRHLKPLLKNQKLQALSFHFIYSMIFLIGWFTLSPFSKAWKNYQFWFY